jgi:hypothetical protein
MALVGLITFNVGRRQGETQSAPSAHVTKDDEERTRAALNSILREFMATTDSAMLVPSVSEGESAAPTNAGAQPVPPNAIAGLPPSPPEAARPEGPRPGPGMRGVGRALREDMREFDTHKDLDGFLFKAFQTNLERRITAAAKSKAGKDLTDRLGQCLLLCRSLVQFKQKVIDAIKQDRSRTGILVEDPEDGTMRVVDADESWGVRFRKAGSAETYVVPWNQIKPGQFLLIARAALGARYSREEAAPFLLTYGLQLGSGRSRGGPDRDMPPRPESPAP